jgi:hypothetical protein
MLQIWNDNYWVKSKFLDKKNCLNVISSTTNLIAIGLESIPDPPEPKVTNNRLIHSKILVLFQRSSPSSSPPPLSPSPLPISPTSPLPTPFPSPSPPPLTSPPPSPPVFLILSLFLLVLLPLLLL